MTYGRLVRALRRGLPLVVFGDGCARLDYAYIDNVVDAEIRAAERLVEGSAVCGQVYFVSDGTPINAGQFSIELTENMGLEVPLIRVPDPSLGQRGCCSNVSTRPWAVRSPCLRSQTSSCATSTTTFGSTARSAISAIGPWSTRKKAFGGPRSRRASTTRASER